MTKEEAIEELEEYSRYSDVEAAHCCADGVLIRFLNSLGYEDVIDVYKKVPKWYA